MLLLCAKGHTGDKCEAIRGRTRLMKMVFLFDKEIKKKFNMAKIIEKDALPVFVPFDFGPFSPQVYNDLEFLVDLGFVKVEPAISQGIAAEEALEYRYWRAGSALGIDDTGPENEEVFALTELGIAFVDDGQAGTLNQDQWTLLEEFKIRCTGAPLSALLRYVYAKYPDMITESKIREEILSEKP